MKTRHSILLILALLLAVGCVENRARSEAELRATFFKKPLLFNDRAALVEKLGQMGFESDPWTCQLEKRITNIWFVEPVLLVATEDNLLYAINPSSGVALWCYDVRAEITRPPYIYRYPEEKGASTPPDEVVIVTGQEIHLISMRGGSQMARLIPTFSISSGAWASRSHVFVGSSDERVYAFRKDKITDNAYQPPQWQKRTGGDVQAAGEVKDPSVLVVSEDGKLYSFNTSTGNQNWVLETQGPIVSSPFYYRGRLYFGSMDTGLYGLNADDGRVEWKFGCESPITKTPVAIGTDVYCIASNKILFTVDRRNGSELWRVHDVDRILCSGRDKVYILNPAKEIVAANNKTGTVLWKEPAFKSVDFFVQNTNPEIPIIIMGFKNGWIFGVKEKEKY